MPEDNEVNWNLPPRFDEHQVEEPLFFNEGCQEDNEVNWNLPPRFDELEVEELQASVLEPCGIAVSYTHLTLPTKRIV